MPTLIKLSPPLLDKDIISLKIGDKVLINGIIYVARDMAHKKIVELIKQEKEVSFDLKGQILYYCGPTPHRPGKVVGAAGPTTSARLDPFTPLLLEKGLKGMIGKGRRSKEVKEAIQKHKAVYFAATGGAGAFLSKHIKKIRVIAYPELGPEALQQAEVEDFPVIVANDIYGGDIFEEGVKKYHV